MAHTFENCLKRIIFLLSNGIELMIMAPRATYREAEECGAGGADHVVQFVRALI